MATLSSRIAAVTGGAGPLGAVLSDELARHGARVVIIDRDPEAVAATVAALPDVPGGHVALPQDLMAPGALDAVEASIRELGGLDVLVNNAAFTGTSGVPGFAVPFDQQTDEAFELALRLNLTVPFGLCRRLAPLLAAHSRGSIINVSSIYGLVGPNMNLYAGTTMGNPAAYGASKGGVVQLTRYMATVLAPRVRVNAFAPGGIARGQASEFVERYARLAPLGRMAIEDDFRGIVAYLASDDSSYVTGQLLAVDGGWTAW